MTGTLARSFAPQLIVELTVIDRTSDVLLQRTINVTEIERRNETSALLGEEKRELAGACSNPAKPRCRVGRRGAARVPAGTR